ncbi:MAG TPA: methyltransferase domain-containing protein [Terriglobales bacterium]|nr:methyltransferase domain-containing protein [Terriglobales bacterium]
MVQSGQRMLDAGCGTGVVAITAARRGACVSAIDLTLQLLGRARENAATASVHIDWHEATRSSCLSRTRRSMWS